jgi:CheY-like chemotaxis protein
MPGTDGYAVVAALAADPALSAIPVLVVTSAELSAAAAGRLGHAGAVVPKRGLTARRLAALLGLTDLTDLTDAPAAATDTIAAAPAPTLASDVHRPAETANDDPL